MKKIKLLAVCALSAALLVGCGSKSTPKVEDEGTTTPVVSEGTKFTGTKNYETLYDSTGVKGDVVVMDVEFKDGEPVNFTMDVRQENGTSKKEEAAAGNYVMVEGSDNTWDKQIADVEKFIKENNFDLTKVNITDEEGHTDAVSGVSVKIKNYIEALEYVIDTVKDGKELETGFTGAKIVESLYEEGKTDMVKAKAVFQHGKPVNVSVDVITNETDLGDGKTSTSKKAIAAAGKYVMVEGSDNTWDKQIAAVEAFIVENNFDLGKVTLTNEEGNTDAVSGVSIKVGTYVKALEEVLK